MSRQERSVHVHMRQMQIVTFLSAVLLAAVFMLLAIWQNYQYGTIISNLTKATEFNFEFKTNIDYKMYRIVIGTDTFQALTPYQDLDNSRRLFQQLRDSTKYEESKKGLDGLLTLVNMLEARMKDIEDSDIIGSYDKNMKRLDNDIYMISGLIEEKMSEYIYNETKTLESLRQDLERQAGGFILAALFLAGALLLFLIQYFAVFSRKITAPLHALCEHTRKFAGGQMDAKAPDSDIAEIQLLSAQYDDMSDRIRELITNIREEQKLQQQTELKLLQAQINPHFLYNTLDAIVWLAESRQNKKVVEMITSLSAFLRIGLNKGMDIINIEKEISHVRNYLQIQHFRYEDILDYRIDIEDEILSFDIPKMTLQPIVENALYHGIKNKRGKGMLLISGWLERRNIVVIQIEDNGIGIGAEKLKQLRMELNGENDRDLGAEGAGFGLKNVSDRIRLKDGRQYGLMIESEYGIGTVVTIRIPGACSLRE